MNRFKLDRVSAVREKTLSLVRDLSQEELDYSPDNQQWSPGEILDHLIRADETYTNQLKRLIDLAKSGRRPFISVSLSQMDYSIPLIPRAFLPLADVPMGLLNIFVPSTLREGLLRNRVFAVSAPEALQPAGGRSGQELRRELVESLQRIAALFIDNPDVDFAAFRGILGRLRQARRGRFGVRRQGFEADPPESLRIGVGCDRLPLESNCDGFTGARPTPQGDGRILLEHHVGADDGRYSDLGPKRSRYEQDPRQKPSGHGPDRSICFPMHMIPPD